MSDGDSEDRHTTSFRKLARARPRVQGEGEVGKKKYSNRSADGYGYITVKEKPLRKHRRNSRRN